MSIFSVKKPETAPEPARAPVPLGPTTLADEEKLLADLGAIIPQIRMRRAEIVASRPRPKPRPLRKAVVRLTKTCARGAAGDLVVLLDVDADQLVADKKAVRLPDSALAAFGVSLPSSEPPPTILVRASMSATLSDGAGRSVRLGPDEVRAIPADLWELAQSQPFPSAPPGFYTKMPDDTFRLVAVALTPEEVAALPQPKEEVDPKLPTHDERVATARWFVERARESGFLPDNAEPFFAAGR